MELIHYIIAIVLILFWIMHIKKPEKFIIPKNKYPCSDSYRVEYKNNQFYKNKNYLI